MEKVKAKAKVKVNKAKKKPRKPNSYRLGAPLSGKIRKVVNKDSNEKS